MTTTIERLDALRNNPFQYDPYYDIDDTDAFVDSNDLFWDETEFEQQQLEYYFD